jgi:hypothetical protein
MDQTYVSSQLTIYHDTENGLIGRKPTKSNLNNIRSDNSLYFGVSSNESVSKIMCDLFHLRDMTAFGSRHFTFIGYGKTVKVETNINSDQQVQIKIDGDGTMGKLFFRYLSSENGNVSYDDLILVLDFRNHNIYFERVRDIHET